jgi:methionyl-tRNA formyltransferase
MGTPQFAVTSLDELLMAGCDIVGVVTAPDKPAGRGQKLSESAVKEYAVAHGLKVMQPEKLRDQDFLDELKALEAEVFVIVAFRMLPEIVWTMPIRGTVNLHASLLPQYRGAAPINWVLINGEKETGVTTFFLKQEIDTGNLLFTEKVTLTGRETAGELHDRLMDKGIYPQHDLMDGAELKHAPKIFKEDCKINWKKDTTSVFNFIRGLSPIPTAYTELNGKVFKIYYGEPEIEDTDIPSGDFITDNKTYLKFATTDGFISVTDVQLEGKKRMGVAEFLRGVKL